MQAALLLGNALAGLKDFEGAVKELEEAAQLDPTVAAAYTSLGMVHLSKEASPRRRPHSDAPSKSLRTTPAPHLALAQYLLGHRRVEGSGGRAPEGARGRTEECARDSSAGRRSTPR